MRKPYLPVLVVLLFGLFFPSQAYCGNFYLDAARGNDSLARRDTTNATPYKTWSALRAKLLGGDTVTVATGNYGNILEAVNPLNVFSSLVTIEAAEGAQVHFDSIKFGRNASSFLGADRKGTYDANVKFVGIIVDDGVSIYGGCNIEFDRCGFQRIGPWTGSEQNIEKIAFIYRCGSHLSVRNCEVTRTGVGFSISGSDVTLRNNNIHDITHDGIRCVGLASSLFEGNTIHGLDDGVSDADAEWSKHSDGVHIFIEGAATPGQLFPNSNLTFRNNTIYETEAMGIQFNNYYAFPEIVNNNILIENNIFAATGAISVNVASPVSDLVFRHNSFVTGTRSYTSPYTESRRTITCSNNSLRISSDCVNVKIYNNILGSVLMEKTNPEVFDFNYITSPYNNYPYSRYTLISSSSPYASPSALTGILSTQSTAINAGTILPEVPQYAYDIYGTARDSSPDLGAYEMPSLNPGPVRVALEAPAFPMSYVDDFEDADMTADPYLNGATQAGLAWEDEPFNTSSFLVTRRNNWRNCLSTPFTAETASVILALPSSSWDWYSFEFAAENAYIIKGAGPVLMYQDSSNYFMLDIGRDTGNLIIRRNGVDTMVASSSLIRMPHSGTRCYKINVGYDQGLRCIFVDADDNGSKELIYRIPNGTFDFAAIKSRVGFYYTGYQNNLKMFFDNIAITNTGIAGR